MVRMVMGRKHNPQSIRNFLRVLALSYPEVVEEFPWGDMAFKVRNKAFLFLCMEPGELSFSVRLPRTGETALGLSFTDRAGSGLGRRGWVTARIASEEDIPLETIAEWIDESYRTIAPRSLVAKLDQPPKPSKAVTT